MSGEVQLLAASHQTYYFIVSNGVGQVWNTSTVAFESYLTANYANYAISMTEQGTASHFYIGNFPTTIPAGAYSIQARQQLGGGAAETDPTAGVEGSFQWNGSAIFPRSDLATSGIISQFLPERIARGTQVLNFPIYLVSSADHVTPFTSGILSGQISKDGAAFGPLQSGAFTEIGLGFYSLSALTSGDLLANSVALRFSANGISGGQSDPRPYSLTLQRTSGQ